MEKGFKDLFEKALKENRKADAHRLVFDAVINVEDIITLYEAIIPGILNAIDCQENDAACVWLEHQMSAIVRSVVEANYKKVLEFKRVLSEEKHVLIACLKDETHELGALIGAHLFELYGFKTTYVGANTPFFTLKNAIEQLKPDYLVLSVTNMYNLFEMRKVITRLKEDYPTLPIYGSGRGAALNRSKLPIDHIVSSSEDIKSLLDREGLVCSR